LNIHEWANLGFFLNMALDREKTITLDEAKDAMENGQVLPFLKNKLGDGIDLSMIEGTEKATEIEERLTDICLGQSGRERRKFGIENNGFALILAYILEVVNQDAITKP